MCGFIAQLVEHRTGIADVTGSNPVEALIFFRLLYSNCLNWKFTAKIAYHLHIYPQFTYESFHIHYIISLLSRKNMNSQLTSLPMCGFIAQLVEHRTGIADVTGSNPIEALIFFFRLLYSNCFNWKFTAKITYHLELISFMEGSAESGTLLFKLSSLHELYVSRLRSLHVDNTVNKTRLKNRIMEHYHGEIQEQSDGKNTVLVFNQGI